MEFQRARTDEQREQRRRVILDTAADMLSGMPVAELSLNELSRRVGLAKSNVLRYFETREAVLLELLATELQEWVDALGKDRPMPGGDLRDRSDGLAALLAESLAARPMLCDLASAQAAVLERNVSTEVVLSHKRAVRASAEHLARTIMRVLPELGRAEALQVISIALLMTSAIWPRSHPTEALLEAYRIEPVLAELDPGFAAALRGTLQLSISGLIARRSLDESR